MKLSKNFSLDEMTKSSTAEAHDIENYPNAVQIENLKALCENVLQPISDYFGCAVFINSGFRSEELNTLVKGAKNSEHLANNFCAAADIHVVKVKMKDVFEYIKNNLEFNQLIDEKNLSWIHVSFSRIKNKNQILKIK